MKKKIIILSIVLVILALAVAGFFAKDYLFPEKASEDIGKTEETVETEPTIDTTTPFRVTIPAESDEKPDGLYDASIKRLEGLADAPIEWKYMNGGYGQQTMKKNIGKGKYPGVVIGKVFTSDELSQYASKGILLPIEDYINETDTPNIWKLYQERPDVKKASIAADGHIYTLPSVKEFMPDYIESAMWINKTWLDKMNLGVPRTLVELKNVLRAFKENDPNGNGEADEVPMTFYALDEGIHPEMLLSSWGISSKAGTGNYWLNVKNGEVRFTPVMDEWKEMVTYYRELYREGLLDSEVFEHDNETFLEKLQEETTTIGVLVSSEKPELNGDEYVAMAPLKAKSNVKPSWHVNPLRIGTKNAFCMFKNCKNPGAAMRWIDKFYLPEESIRNAFGEPAENSTFSVENDVFMWNELPEEDMEFQDYVYRCILTGAMPCYLPMELYGTETLPLREEWKSRMEVYEIYKPYLDQEPWTRPDCTVEESERLTELITDIAIMVKVKLEKWIIDGENLENDWELYKQNLELMDIDEFVEMYQDIYTRSQATAEEAQTP